MRALLQRVTEARVEVEGMIAGSILHGLVILLGIERSDTEREADYLITKIVGLRIFDDALGKMNKSVRDVDGELLIVSQFTLYGDCSKGRRPGFDRAARADEAKVLYDYFIARARATRVPVKTGVFQATMSVHLVNSGPVTLLCDSVRIDGG